MSLREPLSLFPIKDETSIRTERHLPAARPPHLHGYGDAPKLHRLGEDFGQISGWGWWLVGGQTEGQESHYWQWCSAHLGPSQQAQRAGLPSCFKHGVHGRWFRLYQFKILMPVLWEILLDMSALYSQDFVFLAKRMNFTHLNFFLNNSHLFGFIFSHHVHAQQLHCKSGLLRLGMFHQLF